MRWIKLFLILLMISLVSLNIDSQQVNTLYFMENIPVRHFLNPSFQPTNDFYLSLPVVGFTQFNIGNNSVSLKDIIYNVNGKTITFLNTNGDIGLFYNTLKSNTIIRTDFQTNLLSFGFRQNTAYWTFSVTEKIDGTMNLPKDIFKISLFGTPDPQNNSFNFRSLQSNVSVYTEIALGYSKKLDDTWRIGGKLKLLLGQANISNNNNQFLLQAGTNEWNIKGDGTLNMAIPGKLTVGTNFQNISYTKPAGILDWINPTGIGAGIDVGVEYRLNDKIKLSGALNDIGFIRWMRNSQNYHYGVDYSFSGIKLFNSNSTINTFQDVYNQLFLHNALVDTIVTAFNSSSKTNITSNSYTTATTAKLNLGFEYSILNNKLSFGILSYSQLFKNIISEEITGSLNARPYKWLNGSLSYSVIQGRMSTLGAGLGLKTGIFNWFIAADYIPFEKSTLSLTDLDPNYPKINIPIPYNSTTFNVSAGLNLVFDKKNDKSDKITRHRSLNLSNGLFRSSKKQDCNCDWK